MEKKLSHYKYEDQENPKSLPSHKIVLYGVPELLFLTDSGFHVSRKPSIMRTLCQHFWLESSQRWCLEFLGLFEGLCACSRLGSLLGGQ